MRPSPADTGTALRYLLRGTSYRPVRKNLKCGILSKVLLKEGAGLEQTDRLGRTPLIVAAAEGHTGVLELLLQVGRLGRNIILTPS